MGITELVQSSGWKSFTAKLYGFGASIVMIGALFKIMHWPGAGIMITVGMMLILPLVMGIALNMRRPAMAGPGE